MMNYAPYDDALEILSGKGPEIDTGAPNHGPMAAEALAALDRSEAITGWISRYRPRLRDVPKGTKPIGGEWPEALGDAARLGDWEAYFQRQLAEDDWPAVVDRWILRLIPGTMAAGTHGIIRVGHVVRALSDEATRPRRDELARALAYCASRYRPFLSQPLPTGARDVEHAIESLPRLPAEFARTGPPPKIVRALEGRNDFRTAVDEMAPQHNAYAACSALAEAGARMYLANADRHPLVLLHSITAPAAVQLFLPHVSVANHTAIFAYVWQAIAAWTSAFTSENGNGAFSPRNDEPAWNDVIDRAIESDDEHSFKLTEAARRQESLTGSPLFRRVAADWVSRALAAKEWTPEKRVAAGIDTRIARS